MNITCTNYGAFRLTQQRANWTLLDTETDEAVSLSRQQALSLQLAKGDKEEIARALHWAVSASQLAE